MRAQTQTVPTNRYGMKLDRNDDGSYSLQQQKKYDKQLPFSVSALPDVLKPYEYTPVRLNSKDYKGVRTLDYVYKTTEGRELSISVDFSADENAASPFMIYIHGGGWSRGDRGSSRSLSQYLAKQHGITGVRVEYSLAGKPGVTVETSVQDVLDALKYVQDHAVELKVDPSRYGFLGTSAGGHLAAVAAMKTQPKALVGYSGIYDLTTAAIVQKSKDADGIAYFKDRDPRVLEANSGALIIPKKGAVPPAMLVCGTADVTVECEQSKDFAQALKKRKGEVCLDVYPNYDHNVSAKGSDKMEEIFFNTVDFLKDKLGASYVPAPEVKKAKKEGKKEAPKRKLNPASGITTTSQVNAVPELEARGIHTEAPDSSGIHKNNHFYHIVKTHDEELGREVYSFLMHAVNDDDRGMTKFTDRQRNEVKTDSKSPADMWAKEGETMTYRWKMRLPEGMKTTERFCHIHQLKGIDNKAGTALVGRPLLTFSCNSGKKGTQALRIRYYDRRLGDNVPATLAEAPLSDFLGHWVQIEETVKFAANGSYYVKMTDLATGKTILEYSNPDLDMWRTDAPGLRPKWGIYRFLGADHELVGQLRDEELRFADFEIEKKK